MVDVASTTRRHQALAAASRLKLLSSLDEARRPLTVDEAAEAVGLRPSTTRTHLERLVEVGLVERSAQPRRGPGRPRSLYASTPGALELAPVSSQASYRDLACLLASELETTRDPQVAAVEAGRRWAKAMERCSPPGAPEAAAVVSALVGLLHELGFDPDDHAAPESIHLRRCPFADVAREHRAVVCGVHLGLLTGSVERWGGPVRVRALQPFVQEHPLRCVVRLSLKEGTAS